MLTILELRKMTGLSQSKFANKYNISKSTLQKWEQEVNPTPQYYLYSMNELLKYEGYFYEKGQGK